MLIQVKPDAELCLRTVNAEQPPCHWSGFPSGWPAQVVKWTTGIALIAVDKCSCLRLEKKFESAAYRTRIWVSITIKILGKVDNLCRNFISEEIQRKKRVKIKFLHFGYKIIGFLFSSLKLECILLPIFHVVEEHIFKLWWRIEPDCSKWPPTHWYLCIYPQI